MPACFTNSLGLLPEYVGTTLDWMGVGSRPRMRGRVRPVFRRLSAIVPDPTMFNRRQTPKAAQAGVRADRGVDSTEIYTMRRSSSDRHRDRMARRARAFRGFVPGLQPLEGRRLMTADVQLSRLSWSSATNGLGPVEIDRNNGGSAAGDGGAISLDGATYAQGLGVYGASDVQYALAGRYSRFQAVIGVDDVAGPAGSVVFQVWADGSKLYDSGVVTGASAAIPIDVDVAGRTNLRLVVTDGGDGDASDLADWADARLVSPPALVGGDFATPQLSAGSYSNAPSGSPWQFSAASGLNGAGLAADGSTMTQGDPAAPSGGQVAFVRGTGSISQSTAKLHAGRYTVAFKAAQRSPNAAAQDFKITLDGVEVGRFTPSGAAYGSYATATFNVAAGVHVLAFVGLNSAGGDAAALIDDVSMARIDAAASFASTDATTKGDWKGSYGSDGYSLAGDATSLPAYASVVVNANLHVWTTDTTDVRALQKASTGRVASVWNSAPQFGVDVDLNDGRTHRVSLHALDWSTFARIQRVDVLDAGTGALLDSRTLSDFNGGVYATWDLQGKVQFRVVKLAGINAVVSGIFFDAVDPPDTPTGVAASATSPTSTLVTWAAAAGAGSYAVERSLDGTSWIAAGTAGAGATSFADAALADDARYYYRVTAVNPAGSSAPSVVASATTPLAAPTGVAAEFFASNRIDVTWTDASVAEGGYVVEQSADGVAWAAVVSAPAGAARAVVSGPFSPSAAYYFRVRAYSNATGSTSSYSATASATTPAIAAPGPLAAYWSSGTQASLYWADNSSNETGFRVERSTDGVTWTSAGSPTAGQTSFTVAGLTLGTTYQFRVRAYNGSGESANSNVAVARVGAVPAAPLNLAAVPAGPDRINLAWTDAATNETSYRIERSTDGVNFPLLTTSQPNQPTAYASSLTPGTTYYFRVRAVNAENSAWSDVVSATTTVQPPAAPFVLTATAASSSQVDLAWRESTDNETGYKVERSTDGVTWTLLTTTYAYQSTYSATGLAPGTTYQFRVRATNASGDSASSNVATAATLLLNPPTNLVATVVSGSRIDLGWYDAATNETAAGDRRGEPVELFGDRPLRRDELLVPGPRRERLRRLRLVRRRPDPDERRAGGADRPDGDPRLAHQDQPLVDRPGDERDRLQGRTFHGRGRLHAPADAVGELHGLRGDRGVRRDLLLPGPSRERRRLRAVERRLRGRGPRRPGRPARTRRRRRLRRPGRPRLAERLRRRPGLQDREVDRRGLLHGRQHHDVDVLQRHGPFPDDRLLVPRQGLQRGRRLGPVGRRGLHDDGPPAGRADGPDGRPPVELRGPARLDRQLRQRDAVRRRAVARRRELHGLRQPLREPDHGRLRPDRQRHVLPDPRLQRAGDVRLHPGRPGRDTDLQLPHQPEGGRVVADPGPADLVGQPAERDLLQDRAVDRRRQFHPDREPAHLHGPVLHRLSGGRRDRLHLSRPRRHPFGRHGLLADRLRDDARRGACRDPRDPVRLGRLQHADQPELVRPVEQRDGIQGREVDRRRELRRDRDEPREPGLLPGHRPHARRHLLLPGARLQRPGPLGVLHDGLRRHEVRARGPGRPDGRGEGRRLHQPRLDGYGDERDGLLHRALDRRRRLRVLDLGRLESDHLPRDRADRGRHLLLPRPVPEHQRRGLGLFQRRVRRGDRDAARRPGRADGDGGGQLADRPEVGRPDRQRDRLQGRAVDRRGEFRPGRYGRLRLQPGMDVLRHVRGGRGDVRLPRAGDQRGGRLGLLGDRLGDDAAAQRADQPPGVRGLGLGDRPELVRRRLERVRLQGRAILGRRDLRGDRDDRAQPGDVSGDGPRGRHGLLVPRPGLQRYRDLRLLRLGPGPDEHGPGRPDQPDGRPLVGDAHQSGLDGRRDQ